MREPLRLAKNKVTAEYSGNTVRRGRSTEGAMVLKRWQLNQVYSPEKNKHTIWWWQKGTIELRWNKGWFLQQVELSKEVLLMSTPPPQKNIAN